MGSQGNIQDGGNGQVAIRHILAISRRWEVPFSLNEAEAWLALSARLQFEPGFSLRPLLKLAASLLLGLMLAGLYASQNVRLSTSAASQQAYRLPDGSEVRLNAESQLSYNRIAWLWKRSVNMRGEAYFQVRSGSRFDVNSDLGSVRVLGTQFNVYDRKSEYEVACTEGRVRVEMSGSSVLLTSGQQTQKTGTALAQPSRFVTSPSSWTSGEFYFEKAPLSRVLQTLEQQYGITVYAERLGQRTYTGYFTNRNLDEALTLVCRPLGIRYEIGPGLQVTLFQAGNN